MDALVRLLVYAGATLVVGHAVARAIGVGRPSRRLMLGGWLTLLASALVLLQRQAAALELEPGLAPLRGLVWETVWGQGWLVLAMAVILGLGATAARASALVELALAAALSVAMGGLGHAAADMEWPLLARVLDAAHVMGVGAWIGGLLVMSRALADAPPETWRRYSRVATIAAPVVVLTGVGASLRQLAGATVADAVASDYGRLLLLKIALALAVLALGAAHRRRVAAGNAPPARGVRAELLVALAVFAVTSVLTGTSPPVSDGPVDDVAVASGFTTEARAEAAIVSPPQPVR